MWFQSVTGGKFDYPPPISHPAHLYIPPHPYLYPSSPAPLRHDGIQEGFFIYPSPPAPLQHDGIPECFFIEEMTSLEIPDMYFNMHQHLVIFKWKGTLMRLSSSILGPLKYTSAQIWPKIRKMSQTQSKTYQKFHMTSSSHINKLHNIYPIIL